MYVYIGEGHLRTVQELCRRVAQSIVHCKIPRKQKLADFLSLSARAPCLFPRINPRYTRRLIKTGRLDKNSVLSRLLAESTRKEGSTRRQNKSPECDEINEFSCCGHLESTTVSN